jgi:endonuclease/exonuclease/phosphatase family metal-dependent hydrolase
MILKILSYNIHKGFDWNNKNYFLKEIKDFIRASDVDLVFLQEVVGKNTYLEKSGFIDTQFEYLADELWQHYSYAQNAVYDHGHHGNLILSKYPILSFENINISTNRFEQRGFLLCKIAIDDTDQFFYAACSHLNLLNGGRLIQYQLIKNILADEKFNSVCTILAGDFNDWNKKSAKTLEYELNFVEVFKKLSGDYAKTFPAPLPLLCLDRVYIKNATVHNAKVFLPEKRSNPITHFSDHLPIYCEVSLYES